MRVDRLHDSIVVSIPACHAGDRGSIPRRGAFFFRIFYTINSNCLQVINYPNTINLPLTTPLVAKIFSFSLSKH